MYRQKALAVFVLFVVLAGVAGSIPAGYAATNTSTYTTPTGIYYEVRGDTIYMINVATGEETPIHLFGVNWFGFETPNYVVHGLWSRNWEDMLLQIKSLGFNAIRLPFCTQSVKPGTMPTGIDYAKNPDLQGLDSVQIMEKIIKKAGDLGIFVLLDYHRIGCNFIEPLWYTDSFSEQDYINTWVEVAQRFGKYWNVIGADLKNEPHSSSPAPAAYTDGSGATWGMGNNATDWNLAAERIGKAILEVAPHWLIFVEGTQFTTPEIDGSYKWGHNAWWGGNLMGVRKYPVNLPRNKLVYSPHVYGPDVYDQPYFDPAEGFPDNLPDIWYHHFGYVKLDLGYPVVIGEFGGKYGHGGDPRDVTWQNKIIDWMIQNKFCDFFYWSWNPNSGDTGGILQDDWTTIWEDKYNNLKRLMDSCSGNATAPSVPTTTTTTSTPPTTTTTTTSTPTTTTQTPTTTTPTTTTTTTTTPSNNVPFETVNVLPTSSQYEGTSVEVVCDGTQCASSVWGAPNLWGVVKIGNATMDPNVWGWEDVYKTAPQDIGTGSTKMEIRNGVLKVTNLWNINMHPKYNTMAYPEVIYGAKPWGNQPINAPNFVLPIKVSQLPRILVDTKYTLEKSFPGNNFAFEAWLFKDANNMRAPGQGDYEIMVQLYIEGGYPAGYDKGPVLTVDVPIIVDGRLLNQTFELYDVIADAGWRFFTFKPTKNYNGSEVVFDYTKFIEIVDNYLGGGSLTNHYLMSLEFGTEIYTNGCTSFPCTVDVRWTLDKYRFILAPGTMATEEAMRVLVGEVQPPASTTTSQTTTSTTTPTPTTTTTTQTSTTTTTTSPPTTTAPAQDVIKLRYPDDGQWPEAPIDRDGDGNPEFYIEINPWNILSAEGYAEMTYNLSSGVLHYVQALDSITLKNGGAWVHGYPEIFYGNKPWNNNSATDGEVPLPGKVSNLSNFYLTVSYKLLPKNGLPINLAIESWLTREPWRNSGINSDEQELMIWLYYDGLQPAGSKVKEIVVPIVVNGTPVNATFEVWKANIGWEYVAFRIKTPIKEGTVTIPYGAFISAAANVTSLANYPELYLEDVEVGTEYGTPSTTSAHLEWWFYNVSLEYRPGEPLLSQPPAEGSAPSEGGQTPSEGATTGTLDVKLVNSWGTGAQYEVSVNLDTSSTWKLLIKIKDGKISDIWGASIVGTQGDYVVVQPSSPTASATVGFVTSGNAPLVEEAVLLSGDKVLATWTAPTASASDLNVTIKIDSEWDSGFVVKIYVTNNGNAPVSSWQIKLRMTSLISSIWGGTYTASGDVVTIVPTGNNTVINPGDTVEIGFVASKQGAYVYPELIGVEIL